MAASSHAIVDICTASPLHDVTRQVHFPPEAEYGFQMDLEYRPHADTVDMQMIITPTKDILGFEIFFASYVYGARVFYYLPSPSPCILLPYISSLKVQPIDELLLHHLPIRSIL
jgi:hypothetical protein